jgi:hypothetical protein
MGRDDDTTISTLDEQADKSIRRVEVDGVWYFSVIDVIGLLTDAAKPRQYWYDMKRYIQTEGFVEVSEKIRRLKLVASDGKLRQTDAADVTTLLRIIQSIPSPKAEPIKQWLAKAGARRLEEITPVPLGTSIEEVRRQRPADNNLLGMAEWHEHLAMVYRQQAYLESRTRFLEATVQSHKQQLEELASRLDLLEEAQSQLPDLLDRLRKEHLTPEHRAEVRQWIMDLHEVTGRQYDAIYQDLVADVRIGSFSDARDSDWERIAEWFRLRMKEARKQRS